MLSNTNNKKKRHLAGVLKPKGFFSRQQGLRKQMDKTEGLTHVKPIEIRDDILNKLKDEKLSFCSCLNQLGKWTERKKRERV